MRRIFPGGNLELKPDTPIIHTNEKLWPKDQYVEERHCWQIKNFEHQHALKNAEKEFEMLDLGQALKELNIGFDDPPLPGALNLLRDPFTIAMMTLLADGGRNREAPSKMRSPRRRVKPS